MWIGVDFIRLALNMPVILFLLGFFFHVLPLEWRFSFFSFFLYLLPFCFYISYFSLVPILEYCPDYM